MKVEVISSENEWHEALHSVSGYDFFHTFDFHEMSRHNGEGDPLLFCVKDSAGAFLAGWPVLRRGIPGSCYFDFNSVYGYPGPVFAEHVDCDSAVLALLEAMREFGAVSLFSRMHPLFIERLSEGPLRGDALSDVVVVDVKNPLGTMQGYRGGHRREIINSQRTGVIFRVDSECAALSNFKEIYRQSMVELGAAGYYYFDDEYFERLISSDAFKVVLIYAELDGETIAASLFVITGTVMQYYLSGTKSEHKRLAPSKGIIERAHALAIELQLESFILGGGVGSVQDALFKFKSGFSKKFKTFYVTRKIFDEQIYLDLSLNKAASEHSTFFPAYRR